MSTDPRDRLAYFANLVKNAPDDARARFGYANELIRVGQHEDVVREIRAYLALTEDEGNAWGRLAEALTALARPDEAADAYLEGIDQALTHGHRVQLAIALFSVDQISFDHRRAVESAQFCFGIDEQALCGLQIAVPVAGGIEIGDAAVVEAIAGNDVQCSHVGAQECL